MGIQQLSDDTLDQGLPGCLMSVAWNQSLVAASPESFPMSMISPFIWLSLRGQSLPLALPVGLRQQIPVHPPFSLRSVTVAEPLEAICK